MRDVSFLKYRADRRTLATVGAFYGLSALGWSLPLSVGTAATFVPALCLVSFLCAVIAHNSVHVPIFRARALNRIFQVVLSPAYGHPVSMFVPGHNLSHHRHLQTAKDRMRTDRLRWRWNLLNQVFFAWSVGGLVTRDNLRYAWSQRRSRPRWWRQLLLEAALFIGLVALAFAIDWRKALLFVVVPHQYAAWGIMGINFVQHDGCDAESAYNHSRNFVGRALNWLTFNNGYHGIHHMHPHLHWSALPRAHAAKLAPHLHATLAQSSLTAYCWRAYVWPGQRMRFDGQRLELTPPRPDVSWVDEHRTPGAGSIATC